jgi:hypothetical protein
MRRSLLRRARRQSGWRHTVTVAADPLVVPEPQTGSAQVAPAETASDGFAVETHVLARLLGIKLLTLEGVVLVSPARVSRQAVDGRRAPTTSPAKAPSPRRRTDATIRNRGAVNDTAAREGLPRGSTLGEAARLLDECHDELRALEADRITRR